MPRQTLDAVERMLAPTAVRNRRIFTVVAQHNHGASCLTDQLINGNGIIVPHETEPRREDEQERGRVPPLCSCALHFQPACEEPPREATEAPPSVEGATSALPPAEYLLSFVKIHGNVEAESEAPCMRIVDGAVVVVDVVEGVGLHTESEIPPRDVAPRAPDPVLQQAGPRTAGAAVGARGNIPNAWPTTSKLFNALIASLSDPAMGDARVSPSNGTVIFGSALHGWAFTVASFARLYAPKFGVSEAVLTEHFWGDHFYDRAAKQWRCVPSDSNGGEKRQRGFSQFCFEPLRVIVQAFMNEDEAKIAKVCSSLNVRPVGRRVGAPAAQKPDEDVSAACVPCGP